MVEVTITLPTATFIRNVGGKAVKLEWNKVPASVLADLLEGGAKVILGNAFNSGGKDRVESERLAQMQKRIDSWYAGQYAITERGDAQLTIVRDLYIAHVAAQNGVPVKAVEDAFAASIKETYGKDAKVSAENVINIAVRNIAAATDTDEATAREAFESEWFKRADEERAARDAVKAKLDLSNLKL